MLLLVGGIALLAYGLNTASRLGDSPSVMAAGTPADLATWLTALGTISVIAGGLGLYTRRPN